MPYRDLHGNGRAVTFPEDPEVMAAGLDQTDREWVTRAYTKWAAEQLGKPGADLSEMPQRAFLAGYAWGTQFRNE